MLGRLNHVAIAVPDLAKGTQVYSAMLGAMLSNLPCDVIDGGILPDDLAALELPAFISLLQHVAQVGIAVFGTGNLQRGGERYGTALHAFNQTLFALVEQKDDVFDVLG